MLDKSIFALSYCMAHCISFGNCFFMFACTITFDICIKLLLTYLFAMCVQKRKQLTQENGHNHLPDISLTSNLP